MAELINPREAVRARVEHQLAAEQVNLTSPDGRHRTEQVIEETLTAYTARGAQRPSPRACRAGA